jgi:hypothetical protein
MEKSTDDVEAMNKMLRDWAIRGGEFVEKEAPQFAAEVVSWHFWNNILGAIGGLILLLISLSLSVWLIMWVGDREIQFCSPGVIAPAAITIIICFKVGLLCLISGVGNAIKALVAPRLVIIDALRGK